MKNNLTTKFKDLFASNNFLAGWLLVIWLVSLSGFINTCLNRNYEHAILAGIWFIFLTIQISYIVIYFYKKYIKTPNSVIEEHEKKFEELKSKIANATELYNKKLSLIEKEEQSPFYISYQEEINKYISEKGYAERQRRLLEKEEYEYRQREFKLIERIEELKQSRLEVVESLANLEGFKGINALVNNMVKDQIKNKNDK